MYVPCVILLDHIAEALDLIRVKAEPGQLKSLGTDAFVAFIVLLASMDVNAIEV